MRRLSLMVVLVMVVVTNQLWAVDTVRFVDDAGKPGNVSGNIREETQKEVVVESNAGQKRVPVYQIVEVRYDGQPAELVNVRSKFEQGRFEEVGNDLKEIAKTLDGENVNLQLAMGFQMFASLAELAVQDSSKAEEALKWFNDKGEALAKTRHYYPTQEYLGRIYLATKEYAKADQAFQILEQVEWPGYKQKATVMRGIAALKQNQNDNALSLFDQVINATGDAKSLKDQQMIAKVYKAKAQVGLGQVEEAEKLLRESLDQIPPENFSAKALGHNTLGDALRAQKKNPKEVMLEGYLWVYTIYNKDPEQLAYALFNLVDLFQQLKETERAAAMAQTLKTDFPKSEWALKLN